MSLLLVTQVACAAAVRQLREKEELQGHGFVGPDALFFAYSADTEGGASTVLSMYDFAAGTERPMCELGGTGESSFARVR